MTPDELVVFLRAVEGGAFREHSDDWESRTDVSELCEADTKNLISLLDKVCDLLGRRLAPTPDVLEVVAHALFPTFDVSVPLADRTVKFVSARYFGKAYRP